MTGARFDGWTRRRFGVVLGELAATLGFTDVDILGKNRRKRRKKRKKKRCLTVQASCTAGGKRKCCQGLACDGSIDLPGTFCCRPENADCVDDEDCCFPSACFDDGVERFCKPA